MIQKAFGFLILLAVFLTTNVHSQNMSEIETLLIKKTNDFTISGTGSAENWSGTEWTELTQRSNFEKSSGKHTKLKVLYSDTGLYFLFDSESDTLNATMDSHFMELWREDVVEVFLWTDETKPVYFEYELSPLNYELPILVNNIDGELTHWIPFDYSYTGDRKTRHKTSIEGGEKISGSPITKWIAEFFIPFELLRPLENIFPESGTEWKANFYRIDYDHGPTPWSWKPYETNFHDYKNFGTIIFE